MNEQLQQLDAALRAANDAQWPLIEAKHAPARMTAQLHIAFATAWNKAAKLAWQNACNPGYDVTHDEAVALYTRTMQNAGLPSERNGINGWEL